MHARRAAPIALGAFLAACDAAPASDGVSSAPIILHSTQAASVEAPLPDFDLVDQRGRRVQRADLLGKVWVADFIFTTCPTVCPRLTETMAGVARELPEPDVRFVSFSVDPENDTPDKLDAFAKKHGADSERWLFLTGDPATMQRTVLSGFRMALGKSPGGEIFHAERFVVVDKRGTIRAVFDTSPEELTALKAKVRALISE
jgi:protein SCO1/2